MAEEFIIAGWLDFGENRDTVLKHFVECARPSRQEEGCLDYEVSADPDNPGRIFVLERWSEEKYLAAHFTTEHIAVFQKALAEYPRLDRNLNRYWVSGGHPFSSSMVPKV